jgi:hypothetical protein
VQGADEQEDGRLCAPVDEEEVEEVRQMMVTRSLVAVAL